jgi:hypothetical protein
MYECANELSSIWLLELFAHLLCNWPHMVDGNEETGNVFEWWYKYNPSSMLLGLGHLAIEVAIQRTVTSSLPNWAICRNLWACEVL